MPGWQVVNVSGNANNSANTGTFYVNANNDSGNANQNIVSQVSLSECLLYGMATLPLGKTQSKVPIVLVGKPKALGRNKQMATV